MKDRIKLLLSRWHTKSFQKGSSRSREWRALPTIFKVEITTNIQYKLQTHQYGWLIEWHVQGKSKRYYQQCRHKDCFAEGRKDLDKHQTVDTNLWKFGKEQYEINPRQKDGNCSYLPLPGLRTQAWRIENPAIDDRKCEEEDFHNVTPVEYESKSENA